MANQRKPYRAGDRVLLDDETLQSKTGYTREQLSYMLGPLKVASQLPVPIDGYPFAQHLFFKPGPFKDVDCLDALSEDCTPAS